MSDSVGPCARLSQTFANRERVGWCLHAPAADLSDCFFSSSACEHVPYPTVNHRSAGTRDDGGAARVPLGHEQHFGGQNRTPKAFYTVAQGRAPHGWVAVAPDNVNPERVAQRCDVMWNAFSVRVVILAFLPSVRCATLGFGVEPLRAYPARRNIMDRCVPCATGEKMYDGPPSPSKGHRVAAPTGSEAHRTGWVAGATPQWNERTMWFE